MKQQIELFQDDRANNYDEFTRNWIVNYDFVLKSLPTILDMHDNQIRDILVVGCGTGNEIIKLVEHNRNYKITGVDPSKDMIALAKHKLSKLTNIRLIEGTTDSISIHKKYDAASLFLVLHFMKDNGAKEDLLKSISQHLKPNACLVILDIFGTTEEFDFNLKFLKNWLPQKLNGFNISDRINTMPDRISPVSEVRLSELLSLTGFSMPKRFFQSSIYGGWVCTKL